MRVVLVAAVLLFAATACGDDDDSASDDTVGTGVEITAKDYAFVVPASIKGGTITVNYSNEGIEPHFAAFAKVADGKTFADVKAALTAAPGSSPGGPPPFAEVAGAPTAEPGDSAKMTFNLPAGSYALFCAIPSPDGVSHAAKGMVSEVTVTAGETVDQPDGVGTITGVDFALSAPPDFKDGENVVAFKNDGKQLHEINLVELPDGKTIDDLVAWSAAQAGPPPAKFRSGVAVAAGQAGTVTLDLKRGSTYAFICMIPDSLGDFQPHSVKGMKTESFTV